MKKIACVLLLFLSCKSAVKESATIAVDHKLQVVTVTGVPEMATIGLKHDSVSAEAWQSLLSVCKMPADTDLISVAPTQPGKYRLIDKGLSFKPDTPFVKGATYMVRYYRFDDATNEENIMTEHRQLGKTPYTQLVFKY